MTAATLTHEKIAEKAGVSVATVSRVVNGRAGVSPQRAALVRRVMEEMEYRPVPMEERAARAAGRQRAGTIAVVLLDGSYQFAPNLFASQLRGIERGAAENGLQVLVCHATPGAKLPPALETGDVDGLVLLGSSPEPALLKSLDRYPRLWLNSHQEAGGDTVLAGNHRIGVLAADYLMDAGHRHLGFLCAMADLPPYPTRLAAFRFQARERAESAEFSAFTAVSWPLGEATDQAALLNRLQIEVDALVDGFAAATPRPTALFVPNDLMTALVYARLRHHGIEPGDDVLCVSCNHELQCLIGLRPRPATIDIGAEAIGVRGVEQLLWRINHPEDDRPTQLAVEPLLIEPPTP